jgi:hypothetical protein
MIQGQLQLAIMFTNVLKLKTIDGIGNSGNWLEWTSNNMTLICISIYGNKIWIPFQNSSCITL